MICLLIITINLLKKFYIKFIFVNNIENLQNTYYLLNCVNKFFNSLIMRPLNSLVYFFENVYLL